MRDQTCAHPLRDGRRDARSCRRGVPSRGAQAADQDALRQPGDAGGGGMKSNNTAELREKTVDELQTRERELTEQLFKLRFQRATGRIESPAKMRQVRPE